MIIFENYNLIKNRIPVTQFGSVQSIWKQLHTKDTQIKVVALERGTKRKKNAKGGVE